MPDILPAMNHTPLLVVGEPDDADSADPHSPGLIPTPQHPTDPASRPSRRHPHPAGAAR
ncbi:hypothetical protein THIOKS12220022 [Thiocapsa sp. KS1]|nr:hypothetical protein THIOKS12220022 [Thiocapsa sp. KS1]